MSVSCFVISEWYWHDFEEFALLVGLIYGCWLWHALREALPQAHGEPYHVEQCNLYISLLKR